MTASIFHTDLKDQDQKIHFMKNMAMAGGFLVLAEDTKVKGEGKRLGWDEEGVGMGGGEKWRSGEKARSRSRWATWSEALAAGPAVFSDTKELLDV